MEPVFNGTLLEMETFHGFGENNGITVIPVKTGTSLKPKFYLIP